MTIPRDVMTEEDFGRWERGLPPRRVVKVKREDPVPPEVPNQIKELPEEEVKDIGVARHNVQNADGVRFMGYDIFLAFQNEETLEGWLPESEFELLKRRIPPERTDLLRKMSL